MNENLPMAKLEMTITWGDCDAAGITYYAKYFDWFTNGRMQLLRKYGMPYMKTFHYNNIALVGLSANCQYKKLLRPEEEVVLHTYLSALTRTRVTFTYKIYKENEQLAAEGETFHAFVDNEGRPFDLKKRSPDLWEELMKRFGTIG